MSKEGWITILLAGLIYAGITGVFAWTGYIRTGLSVFIVGLLVLIITGSRSALSGRSRRFTASGQVPAGDTQRLIMPLPALQFRILDFDIPLGRGGLPIGDAQHGRPHSGLRGT
jgi:hypothetical protein